MEHADETDGSSVVVSVLSHTPNAVLRSVVWVGGENCRDWLNERLPEREVVIYGYHDAVAIDPDDRVNQPRDCTGE